MTEDKLRERLKSLMVLLKEGRYPRTEIVLGFPVLNVQSEQEIIGRIKELSDILGLKWTIEMEDLPDGYIELR